MGPLALSCAGEGADGESNRFVSCAQAVGVLGWEGQDCESGRGEKEDGELMRRAGRRYPCRPSLDVEAACSTSVPPSHRAERVWRDQEPDKVRFPPPSLFESSS